MPIEVPLRFWRHPRPFYPEHGRTNVLPAEETIYYWWWRFMRRHEGYKKCCESGGTGPLSLLYEKFGDIHAGGFDDWWLERGPKLFAEPQAKFKTQVVQRGDLKELQGIEEQPIIVIIQKDAPQSLIMKRIRQILKEEHPGKPGKKTSGKNMALCKIHQHFVIKSLWKMLSAYELRHLDPAVPLWQVGKRIERAAKDWPKVAKYKWRAGYRFDGDRPDADEMASLTSATSRLISKAAKAIENTCVGKGYFPKFD